MGRSERGDLFLIDPKHRVISSNSDIMQRPWQNMFCPSEFNDFNINAFNEANHWADPEFFNLYHWDGIFFQTIDNADNFNDIYHRSTDPDEKNRVIEFLLERRPIQIPEDNIWNKNQWDIELEVTLRVKWREISLKRQANYMPSPPPSPPPIGTREPIMGGVQWLDGDIQTFRAPAGTSTEFVQWRSKNN